MPAPLPPEGGVAALADKKEKDSDEGSIAAKNNSTNCEYDPEKSSKPILFSQERLNGLIKNLALSKRKAKLLASRLQETISFIEMWQPPN